MAGVSAAQNGEDALGVTLAVFEGIFVGGMIGGAAGALVGVAPTIGVSLSTMMSGTAGAGVMAMSAEAYLVAAGAVSTIGILFSEIPMHGSPNTFIQEGDSFGEYDTNGNLMYRTDTGHSHFIKRLQQAFQPHAHHFNWYLRDGIWRYIETILPR